MRVGLSALTPPSSLELVSLQRRLQLAITGFATPSGGRDPRSATGLLSARIAESPLICHALQSTVQAGSSARHTSGQDHLHTALQ